MLGHQLGQDFIFGLDLLFEIRDAFLLGVVVGPGFLLESGGPVLEQLFCQRYRTVGWSPSSSQRSETGSFSSKWRLRMATFSSAV